MFTSSLVTLTLTLPLEVGGSGPVRCPFHLPSVNSSLHFDFKIKSFIDCLSEYHSLQGNGLSVERDTETDIIRCHL